MCRLNLMLSLIFILAGCTPTIATPIQTGIPQPTALLTPAVVLTTVPSDWTKLGDGLYVAPEVVELQESVAETKDFTLIAQEGKGDLVLEAKQADGTFGDVADFSVGVDGKITLTVGGQQLEITSLTFDQDGLPVLKGGEKTWGYKDGKWVEEAESWSDGSSSS